MRKIRGVVRRSGREDTFSLILVGSEPDYALAEIRIESVVGFRAVGCHALGELYEVEFESSRPVTVSPLEIDLAPVLGDGARSGVPFVIATPHRAESIRNPAEMGGAEPVERWQGTYSTGADPSPS